MGEAEIDLAATHNELVEIEKSIAAAKKKHNGFLKELGLKLLPGAEFALAGAGSVAGFTVIALPHDFKFGLRPVGRAWFND